MLRPVSNVEGKKIPHVQFLTVAQKDPHDSQFRFV